MKKSGTIKKMVKEAEDGLKLVESEVVEEAGMVLDKMHYHRSPYMRQSQNGSRMVGGKRPTNLDKYLKFESTSYITPDTITEEAVFMRMTKDLWSRRRAFLWVLYAIIGISVALWCTVGS